MVKEKKLISENEALNEEYKFTLLRAMAAFGVTSEVLKSIISPFPSEYMIYPSLEMTCNDASDSFEIPSKLKAFVNDVYPEELSYLKRIKMNDFDLEMEIRYENDTKDPILLFFTNGDCSYDKITNTDGERRVSVVKKKLTPGIMRDIIALPNLIASHYLGMVTFSKMEIFR